MRVLVLQPSDTSVLFARGLLFFTYLKALPLPLPLPLLAHSCVFNRKSDKMDFAKYNKEV